MDLDLLVSCANSEGDKLIAGSFGFSSWMGISITPSFVLNEHHKISGFPSNFSAELCLHLQHAAAQQASGEPAQLAGGALGQDRGGMHEAPQHQERRLRLDIYDRFELECRVFTRHVRVAISLIRAAISRETMNEELGYVAVVRVNVGAGRDSSRGGVLGA